MKKLLLLFALIIIPSFSYSVEGELIEARQNAETELEKQISVMVQSIIPKDDFIPYVSLDLTNDQKRIDEYFDAIIPAQLPGMPISDVSSTANNGKNSILTLIEKKHITLVINETISAETEKLIKEIVSQKINLKEGSDLIEFKKQKLYKKTTPETNTEPKQGLSKEAIIGISLLAILGLAAFFILFVKQAKLSGLMNKPNESSQNITIKNDSGKKETHDKENTSTPLKAETPTIDAQYSRKDILDLKEKLISLTITHSKAANYAVRKLLSTPEGIEQFTHVVYWTGIDYAKQLFDSLGSDSWKDISRELTEKSWSGVAINSAYQKIETVTQAIMSEVVIWDSTNEPDGPFGFLRKLSNESLIELLESENPSNVATLAAFWSSEEISKILQSLSELKRKQVILEISRLEKLPKEFTEQVALRFAERLRSTSQDKVIKLDQQKILQGLLQNLDSSMEEEVIDYIKSENPQKIEVLKRTYLMFNSFPILPAYAIGEALDGIEPEVITQALYQAPDDVINAILSSIPKRKAEMVRDDLAISSTKFSKIDVLTSRKTLLTAMNQYMHARKVSLDALIQENDTILPEAA